MAVAIVDDFQFSLAIGKEGQNVRLAAKLTGWKIDIKSASDFEKMLNDDPELRDKFAEEEIVLEDVVDYKEELDDVLDIELDDDEGESLLLSDDMLDSLE